MPNRANGVDDMSGRQAITLRDLCVPRFTPAKSSAFISQLRAGGSMYRPIDTATSEQGAIGGIDDGTDL